MISTVVLNAVLALGVIVMVVAPLAWAISTQRRDYTHTVGSEASLPRTRGAVDRRHQRRPRYEPAVGRA